MEHVLVGVDDSAEAKAALEYALEQFPDAAIDVIHVPETANFTFDLDTTVTEDAEQRASEILENAVAMADEYGREIETELVFGQPGKAIVTQAEERGSDQIVVGSKGKTGAKRILLGSVAETVIRRSSCPVTVVR